MEAGNQMEAGQNPLLQSEPPATGLIKDAQKEIRSAFISKVYGILTAQLCLTALVAAPFVMMPSVQEMVQTNASILMGVALLNLLLVFVMVCPCGCQGNLRKYPLNYCLLGAFTVTEGMLVGVICSTYSVHVVMLAVAATALLVGALSTYAKTTESDFTSCGPYLLVALFGLSFMSLGAMIFPFPFSQTMVASIGIVMFSFYLIFDTQLIMGKGELALTIDDYCFAALTLYLDIIQLFLYILQLLGRDN
eukprot:TRINITY_DN37917_c0_g1_i1.p1 TRINITY_DN37917_c0_g1~~TRINITY_DN37917_c0_g1_i1.p1  ORF type:complete len:249 (-),score=43.80 TRINITY_DN37917_c0_g1_i1:144-890(-)